MKLSSLELRPIQTLLIALFSLLPSIFISKFRRFLLKPFHLCRTFAVFTFLVRFFVRWAIDKRLLPSSLMSGYSVFFVGLLLLSIHRKFLYSLCIICLFTYVPLLLLQTEVNRYPTGLFNINIEQVLWCSRVFLSLYSKGKILLSYFVVTLRHWVVILRVFNTQYGNEWLSSWISSSSYSL